MQLSEPRAQGASAASLRAAAAERRATTPLAGAIAGILFAVLFAVSVTIIALTLTEASQAPGTWLEEDTRAFEFALGAIPFAGLFFLWFIAVARERLGRHEDQFFATVFLGSGLLFVALLFSAAASAGAILATSRGGTEGFAVSSTYLYGRNVVAQIFGVYALRMAAVFQFSQATLWLRTGVMPRWMALLTYVLAIVLLFILTRSIWIVLVFPAWVLLVSTYILVAYLGGRRPTAVGREDEG